MFEVSPALHEASGRSLPWSGASLQNGYAERSEGDKRSSFAVMLIPGLTSLADVGGEIFGYIDFDNEIYLATATTLFSVSEAGTVTTHSALPTGASSTVRMATNLTQIGMVIENTGYIWDGSTITAVPDLPDVTDVAFIDGYFAWTQADTGYFTITDINNGLIYDAADIANAEGAPDNLIGLINDHRELQLYGTKTIEIWYNSGNADFPFSRQGNAFIERGCFAKESVVKLDNSVYFYGDDRIVYRLDGYTPIRVSTHAIEYQLRNCTEVACFTYTHEGHKFYVINTDVGCFALDVSTNLWHRRKSRNREDWRVGGALSIWNTTAFIEKGGGNVYLADFDVFEEDGDPIEFEVTLPTIVSRDRGWQTMYAFEALFETGVGNSDAPAPLVSMSLSRDGGHSWSSWMERSLGAVGEYTTRAIWRKLGKFRQMNIRLRCTDPVRRFVMSYHADVR